MDNRYVGRLLKLVFVGALVAGVMAAGLLGGRNVALAQDTEAQTFIVEAGDLGYANVEALQFAPQNLQIHRGDTVIWHLNGFHNIRFASAPVDLVIAPEVEGQPLPQINPIVGLPSIESGGTYQGGELGSGLPQGISGTFSLMMDVEPGTYSYVCDVHPGMLGTITVVDDATAIPAPAEAAATGAEELDASLNAGIGVMFEMLASTPMMTEGDALPVTVGSPGIGRATIHAFFPFNGVIQAGQSVTWTNPADSIDPHTVTWPPRDPAEDVMPIEQEGGPPILALGENLLGNTQSGAEVGADGAFHSGLLLPGQSFTLTFTEAGVYPYVCHLHPGMQGVITVQPAA